MALQGCPELRRGGEILYICTPSGIQCYLSWEVRMTLDMPRQFLKRAVSQLSVVCLHVSQKFKKEEGGRAEDLHSYRGV